MLEKVKMKVNATDSSLKNETIVDKLIFGCGK
jgi:hypothetical protein